MWSWFIENWQGVIALCALFVTFLQAHSIRTHNKLSVKPYLSTFNSSNNDDGIIHYKFFLTNDGLGPAEVVKFTVFFRNEILAENDVIDTQTKVTQKILDHYLDVNYYVGAYTEGAVLSSKNKFLLLELKVLLNNQTEQNHFVNFLENFDLKVEYKSFYGEKKTLDTRDTKKKK